ncbi:hypothetical protein FAIPA1_600010 [Frankia sp. AiPs1]|uniref:hypothetical protein n=1 Tax=Frankia sp. AiPa1 TaxID=573492 RepID=UPI00202AD019|nr:hypothetical protein [Frankia sp. AiPa1]MCL9759279.1 hypothetical protein [Frankia sp. AiPa1]
MVHPNTLATAATGVATVDNLLAFEFHHAAELGLSPEQLPKLVSICAAYTTTVRPKINSMVALSAQTRGVLALAEAPQPEDIAHGKANVDTIADLLREVAGEWIDRHAEAMALLSEEQLRVRAELIEARDRASLAALAGVLDETDLEMAGVLDEAAVPA